MKRKLSLPALILLAVCIIASLCIASFFITNKQNNTRLSQAVAVLSGSSASIQFLYHTNNELLLAENSFRNYLATKNEADAEQYKDHLNKIHKAIDSLDYYITPFTLNYLQEFLDKRLKISNSVGHLQMLSDSLINISYDALELEGTSDLHFKLKTAKISNLEQYVEQSVDTLTITNTKEKKRLIDRIFSSKKENVSTSKEIKKGNKITGLTTTVDTIYKKPKVEKLANDMQKFYQSSLSSQLQIQKQLKDKEMALANVNHSIIQQIQEAFNIITTQEELIKVREKNSAIQQLNASGKALETTIFSGLTLLSILIIVLVFNIFKINKYENDIIEKRIAAEKIAQLKASFLSNMSHEIRTPLTAIIGFAEQMQKSPQLASEPVYINAIKTSADQLLYTINDVLDFSKLDADKFSLSSKPFLIKQALEDVLSVMKIQADKKNLVLINKIDINPNIAIDGDLYRLRQMLFNLLGNAIKFTNTGSITLDAQLVADNMIVKIEDTGKGIPANMLNHIFEEYAQAENNDVQTAKGTGLGLAITRMLIEVWKGSITVKSELQKGSIFTFTLPYKPGKLSKEQVETVQVKESSISQVNKDNSRILLVEDNELNILLINHIFSAEHLVFDVCTNGIQALQKVKENNYKLVVTDINIPGLTGTELAKAIRSLPESDKKSMPIIALTASISNDRTRQYYQAGINAVVHKPFTQQELMTNLYKYLFAVN